MTRRPGSAIPVDALRLDDDRPSAIGAFLLGMAWGVVVTILAYTYILPTIR